MQDRTRARAALAPLLLAAVALAVACGQEAPDEGKGGAAAYPSRDLAIMAPADPGGGWDQTARAMQGAITKGGVTDKNVKVYNVGGAGGTIGLSQLVSKREGDPHNLMVMGLVMVGAIETNKSPVDLGKVTPIASLTTETEAIVVRSDSKYRKIDDLVAELKRSPRSVSWGGGSAGGTDHIVVGALAKEAGVDPARVNYVANAGGGEAKTAILSGDVTAGVSGLGEFADQIEAGKMRLLAVSTAKAATVDGKPTPTLKEAGYDIDITNWRGVVAPPNIKGEERDAIVAMVEKMHGTPQWRQALKDNGWTDFLRTGDDFAAYLKQETERATAVVRDLKIAQ